MTGLNTSSIDWLPGRELCWSQRTKVALPLLRKQHILRLLLLLPSNLSKSYPMLLLTDYETAM